MAIIKQISVYNGSSWSLDDIGADASNITLSSTYQIGGSNNLETGLRAILPANGLTTGRALMTDANGIITASNITSTQLGYLSDTTGNIQAAINAVSTNANKAIKTITRSGLNFTATRYDNSTFTFTQQDNNTTYNAATTAANGLMTTSMVSKLNGIAANATKNSLSVNTPMLVNSAAFNVGASTHNSCTISGTTISGGQQVGIIGWVTGNTACFIYRINGEAISGTTMTASAVLRNTTDSSQSIGAKALNVFYKVIKIA